MADLLVTGVRVPDRPGPVDVVVSGGRIERVGPGAAAGVAASERIEGDGMTLLPGLVEPHLHLDKALLDAQRPNPDGSLAGAIAVTGELKRSFTAEDVRARATAVLEQAVTHGTTAVRAHPDVDPIVGLLSLDVLLELRESHADLVDLQVVAFPQEGVLQASGTEELLVEALRRGADVVGGCSYAERDLDDCLAQLDRVFALAERFGVPVDVHADFADDDADPRFALAGAIAERTRAHGMAGRVTLGHVTSLAGLAPDDRKRVCADLADAGVAVVVLPFTDMHLGGRADDRAVRRGVAPVRELVEAGVATAFSSNNVRNAFTPFGNADLLDVGLFLAQTGHLGAREDLTALTRMATEGAARIVGLDGRGVRPGADADLVLLAAPSAEEALLGRADRRAVIRRGRVVARTETRTELYRPVTTTPAR